MKKLNVFLISILTFLTSCVGVYFDMPQPKGGVRVNSVPQELQGTWIDTDTIMISNEGMVQTSSTKDSTGKIISSQRIPTFLSDSVMMFKAGKYYIVNTLNKNGKGYELMVIEKQTNGDIYWYNAVKSPFFGTGNGYEVTKVVRNKNGKEIINKSIKNVPGENITEVYYKGQMSISDISKIVQPKNKFSVMKKDGTFKDFQ